MAAGGALQEQTSYGSLGQKQKLSINAFVARNDWIVEKIRLLEEGVLPDIDTLEDTDEACLAELWRQHDEIEREADALDKGELGALRSLARAASQKHLSPEDTDLIDITFKTLESTDKLLRLLRTRNKALKLLRARTKWNGQVMMVKTDRYALLESAVPKYIQKARFRPQEVSGDTSDQRHRSGDHNSAAAPVSSSRPQSFANNVHGNGSTMAHQMRGEILSLDLAALTARIHTLQHVTLAGSGKTLDSMIDAASIPERFIDIQEDLEATVKKGTVGLVDFCSSLLQQWREADGIWSDCCSILHRVDQLSREVAEAVLKLPSAEAAEDFERRLSLIQRNSDEIQNIRCKRVPRPSGLSISPDQDVFNQQLLLILEAKASEVNRRVTAVQTSIATYRKAASALTNATQFRDEASSLLNRIRQHRANFPQLTIEHLPGDSRSSEQIHQAALDALRSVHETARDVILPQAASITTELIATGIDPNIRQSVHDVVMALSAEVRHAEAFLDEEARRSKQPADLCKLEHALANTLTSTTHTVLALRDAAGKAVWREGDDTDRAHESFMRLLSDPEQHPETLECTASAVADALDRLEREGLRGARLEQAKVDLKEVKGKCVEMRDGRALLDNIMRQRSAIEKILHSLTSLESEAGQLQSRLNSEDRTLMLLDEALENITDVQQELRDIVESIPTEVPFCAPTSLAASTFDFNEIEIRRHLDTRCILAQSRVDDVKTHLLALHREAVETRDESVTWKSGAEDLPKPTIRTGLNVAEEASGVRQGISTQEGELEVREARSSEKEVAKAHAGGPEDPQTSIDSRIMGHLLDSFKSLVAESRSLETPDALSGDAVCNETAHAAMPNIQSILLEPRRDASEAKTAEPETPAVFIAEMGNTKYQSDQPIGSIGSCEDRSSDGMARIQETYRTLDSTTHSSASTSTTSPEMLDVEVAQVDRRAQTANAADHGADDLSQLPADPSTAMLQTTQASKAPQHQQSKPSSRAVKGGAPDFAVGASPAGNAYERDAHSATESLDLQAVAESSSDVFGPTILTEKSLVTHASLLSQYTHGQSPSTPQAKDVAMLSRESIVNSIDDLVTEIESLDPTSLRASGRRLPTMEEAEAAQRHISLLHARMEDLIASDSDIRAKERERAQALLLSKTEDSQRFMHLATFESSRVEAESAVSDLIEAIDTKEDAQTEGALARARRAVERSNDCATSIASDGRVQRHLASLNATWRDVQALALGMESESTSTVPSRSLSRSSSVSSSLSSLPLPFSGRRAASARDMHKDKSHFEKIPESPYRLPKPRLDGLPGRPNPGSPRPQSSSEGMLRKSSSVRLSGTLDVSKVSIHAGAPRHKQRASLAALSPSGSTTPLRSSIYSASNVASPINRVSSIRRSSSTVQTLASRPNAYKSNTKRKLDVAVGRIVNSMPVPVSITPAESYQDESGKYWIGSPEPKLYFARILRSKTVMIRVGGGWQELGSFLATHFDQLFHDDDKDDIFAKTPLTPVRAPDDAAEGPRWISSATLRAQANSHSPDERSTESDELQTPKSQLRRSRCEALRQRHASNPMDLTSLLVKSTSHSPPTASTNTMPRSKSATIPWRP